ncbi:efflux RND transporter permease subunit [Oceanispirochaeta crateris]|uniref:efflux RND transporter permease subunit n=1 Tax=Oceanispirochaeta crateris TaxID=2518645 RepID=UPI0024828ACA|nr:efflux RND transporter permease subunit [Oceanispirochaeta crateris]
MVVLEEINQPEGKVTTILRALLTSALTTIIVFLPPLFVPGITSVLFHDLIVTILLTVILTLPVSLSFTPACFSLLCEPQKKEKCKTEDQRVYKKIITLAVKKTGLLWIFICLLIVITVLLFHSLPLEILPDENSEKGILSMTLDRDMDFETVQKAAQEKIRTLMTNHRIKQLYLESGFDVDRLKGRSEAGRSLHDLNIHIQFDSEVDERGFKKSLSSGEYYQAEQSMFESLLRGDMDIDSLLLCQERELLEDYTLEEGFEDRKNSHLTVFQFMADEESLNASGLAGMDLLKTLSADIQGSIAGEIRLSNDHEKTPVLLRASTEYRSTRDDLAQIGIKNETSRIRLEQLGKIVQKTNSAELYRLNRLYMRPILAIQPGLDETEMKGLKDALPTDIKMNETIHREEGQLMRLYLFALVLMFLVLGIQSGSIPKALLLFCSIPLSLPGSFGILKLFNQSLNLYSFMGLLILQGTIVNGAILLVSSYKSESLAPVLTSSVKRIRPISATALTTIAALVPIIITSFKSGDSQLSMPLAVLGGMIPGAVLTMFLIPVLYIRCFKKHD